MMTLAPVDMDWTCEVCGEWADNRFMVGTVQTYWYYLWFCDEHVAGYEDGCEKMSV